MSKLHFDSQDSQSLLPVTSQYQKPDQITTEYLHVPSIKLINPEKSSSRVKTLSEITPKTGLNLSSFQNLTWGEESPVKTPFTKYMFSQNCDEEDYIKEEEQEAFSQKEFSERRPRYRQVLYSLSSQLRRQKSLEDNTDELKKERRVSIRQNQKKHNTVKISSGSNSNSFSNGSKTPSNKSNSDKQIEEKENKQEEILAQEFTKLSFEEKKSTDEFKYIKSLWNECPPNLDFSPIQMGQCSPIKQVSPKKQSSPTAPNPQHQYFTQAFLQYSQQNAQPHYLEQLRCYNPAEQPQIQQVQQFPPVYPQQFIDTNINSEIYLNTQIDSLWGNQMLSRQLQKIFEFGTEEQRDIIVVKIERLSPQIAKDVFGNYVVQKIFEKGTDQQRYKLFLKLKPYFYDLAKNAFGCRVVQKIIDFTVEIEELQDILLKSLMENLKSLIYDVNGNYVLFKLLEGFQLKKIKPMTPVFEECVRVSISIFEFIFMSQQVYGCKIIHKVLELFDPKQTKSLIKLSIVNYIYLAQSECGNYILQFILKNGDVEERSQLCCHFLSQFYHFSVNKYSSNTMEKVLENISREQLMLILNWLLYLKPDLQQ